ncbi:FAD-dependent monooxygenase [Streptomyces sp. NPDC058583]|uniref:FAD-dependent monooxygenase n=1 Tax=unclassified Streptomyces TaxID=2593676 RepID=UPI0036600D50
MRVTVVGGGIAGLTCALSLHAAGFEPQVCEAARTVEAVGVGINLLPHAVRELSELGLDGELASAALPPHRLSYRGRTGEVVWEEPLGRAAGYHWPQYSVHRGRLQMLLLAAVRERLGPESVRTGVLFQRFEETAGGVRARFLDRSSGLPVVEDADVLVGADGIGSAVRAQLYPDENAPRWNGVHMWRGVAPHPHVLDGRSIVVAGGTPGEKLVAYPIEDAATAGGDALVNWVLEVRHGPSAPPPDGTSDPKRSSREPRPTTGRSPPGRPRRSRPTTGSRPGPPWPRSTPTRPGRSPAGPRIRRAERRISPCTACGPCFRC